YEESLLSDLKSNTTIIDESGSTTFAAFDSSIYDQFWKLGSSMPPAILSQIVEKHKGDEAFD
ncbi:hypothetical protein C0995_004881, partial [Termitomyces sp. Mi166